MKRYFRVKLEADAYRVVVYIPAESKEEATRLITAMIMKKETIQACDWSGDPDSRVFINTAVVACIQILSITEQEEQYAV